MTLPTPEAADAARRETAWFEKQREAESRRGAGAPPAAGPAAAHGAGSGPPHGAGSGPPHGPGPAPPFGPGFQPPGAAPAPYGPGPAPPYGPGSAPPYGPGPAPYAAGPAPPYGPGPAPPYGAGPVHPYGAGPPQGPAPPYGPGPAPPYMYPAAPDPPVNPSGLARVVRLLLYANILVASVVGILAAVYLRAVGDLIDAGETTSDRYDDAAAAVLIAYLGQLLLLCVTGGFFIAWLYRVYKNTRGLGATDLRYSEGWAIGGWFVPVMTYWRPKEIVNDAWRASDPGLGVYANRHEWEGKPVPGVFLAWWLIYVAWAVANSVTIWVWGGANESEEEQVGAVFGICTEMILITAALFALRVVTLLTERQNERAAEREQAAVPAAQAPV